MLSVSNPLSETYNSISIRRILVYNGQSLTKQYPNFRPIIFSGFFFRWNIQSFQFCRHPVSFDMFEMLQTSKKLSQCDAPSYSKVTILGNTSIHGQLSWNANSHRPPSMFFSKILLKQLSSIINHVFVGMLLGDFFLLSFIEICTIMRGFLASPPGFKDVGCAIDDSTTANRAVVGGVLLWFTREPCNARANKRHSSGLIWVSRWVR